MSSGKEKKEERWDAYSQILFLGFEKEIMNHFVLLLRMELIFFAKKDFKKGN